MSIRSSARRETERPVPSLQILPRLEAVGAGYGASLRTVAAAGLRVGLLALIAAAAVAAAIFAITHHSHPAAGRGARLSVARELQQTQAHVGLPGVRVASRAMSAAVAMAPISDSPTRSAPAPHDLSSEDLTSLADGSSAYQPAPYLVTAYQAVAARYQIPWRLLAAVEYIQGGYTNAIAGASARAELALTARVGVGGQRAINAAVLADTLTAAAQPSAALVTTGRKLAADGVATSPAHALTTYLETSAATPQSVLTLAQEIGGTPETSTTTPVAKVGTMLNEARLLNGLPYVWGGGHSEPAWVVGSGYDCSGFVSEVLHSAGYLTSPETTQTLPGASGIANGPGKYVTIYDRTIATVKVWVKKKKITTIKKAVNPTSAGVHVEKGRKANSLNSVSIRLPKWVGEWKTIKLTKLVPSLDNNNDDEHVIIDIDGQWWESGGSSTDGGAAMVHQIIDPSSGYLKSFNKILHPQGL